MEITMENKFIAIPENRYCTQKITFARANPNSDYFRILRKCSNGPTTLQEIYPNTKAPIASEVVALAKQGYLQKFSTPKHIHTKIKYDGVYHNTYSKVWYGITSRGLGMLAMLDKQFANGKSKLPF
jgi:hypothetical protein